jgi:hypothetical protein
VKYTGLQWAGNVARISGEGMHTEFWWREFMKNVDFEDHDEGGALDFR